MARPINESLKYFPCDIDIWDDPKILIIEEEFGLKGSYIAIRLLSWIYRNGYYTEWSDDMALAFAKRAGNGINSSLVNQVVMRLVKIGFFDESLFNTFRILTSRGIQKRWYKIIVDSNRIAQIKNEHNLINSEENDNKSEETPEKSEETQEKSEVMQQKKGKETKTNKKKESAEIISAGKESIEPNFIDRIIQIFSEEYKKSRSDAYIITALGKERKAVSAILQAYKQKESNHGKDSKTTLADLQAYFEKCLAIKDKWYYNNMTLPILSSKLNEINNKLKEQNGTHQPASSSGNKNAKPHISVSGLEESINNARAAIEAIGNGNFDYPE